MIAKLETKLFENLIHPFETKSPEILYDISQWIFRQEDFWWALRHRYQYSSPRLETTVDGVQYKNPLIIAAGENKDGKTTRTMISLGYGGVTIGSIRAYPHPGNKRPWFLWDGDDFYNSMGMPSIGSSEVKKIIENINQEIRKQTVLIYNIAGERVVDCLKVDRDLNELCSVRKLNASCPNTEWGCSYQENLELLRGALDELMKQKKMPTYVKISPHDIYNDEERKRLKNIIKICQEYDVGIAATNTLKVYQPKLGRDAGRSGPSLYPMTENIVTYIAAESNRGIPILAEGGIDTPEKMYKIIGLGADLVGTITGPIKKGPAFVCYMLGGLDKMLEKNYGNVDNLRGKLNIYI